MLKAIYDLEPTYEVHEDCGICLVWLTYNGKKYKGIAEVSPDDENFFSEKVGLNIALSRARIKLLKDAVKQARIVADIKYQIYREATEYGKIPPAQVDPTGAFLKKALKAEQKYHNLRNALRKEKAYLNKYLENQDRMVEYIKIHRSKGKKE